MRAFFRAATLILLLTLSVPVGAKAQAPQDPDVVATEEWTFALTPYVWFAGLKGSVGVNENLPVIDVDISFNEVFESIDWWPPPVMLVGEARNGRFAIVTDFLFLGLEADREPARSPIPLSAKLEVDTIIWSFLGSFRALDVDGVTLDFLLGGRLWNIDASGTLIGPLAVRQRSGSRTWADPIIGAVGGVDLGDGFKLQVEGDVGGFGITSDLDWQIVGAFQYAVSEAISLEAGYRHVSVDYSDDGFLFDAALSGPIVGARFRF